MAEQRKCLAVIRVRGVGDASPEVEDTLKMLRLHRNCHATLIDNRPSYVGMLEKAKNFLTWGEISKENVMLLLKKRGRLIGNKKLTDEEIKKLGYGSIEELADSLYNTKVELKSLPNLKPVFRLHPPHKGYKGKVKKSYDTGGVTGYRGETINDLIKRMI